MKFKKTIAFNIIIYSILIISSLFFKEFNSTSYRDGLIIAMIVTILIIIVMARNILSVKKDYLNIIFLAYSFLAFHYFISYLQFQESDKIRFILSYFLIISISIISALFLNISQWAGSLIFDRSVKSLYYLLLLDGIVSSYNYLMGLSLRKEMIFFIEPSHYSLVFLPLLAYIGYQSKKSSILHLLIAIVISFAIENTTLIIGTLIIAYIFNAKKSYLMSTLAITPILLIILNNHEEMININYFLDRVQLESSNISSLVFISGWESAYQNFIKSYGVGIGLQQMGIIDSSGVFREELALLNLDDLNKYDSSSLAPKIITEFGFFGVFAISYYLYYFFIVMQKLKNKKIHQPINIFFAFSFVIFIIDLFIRGTGYLSPPVFIFMSSIYWLHKNKRLFGISRGNAGFSLSLRAEPGGLNTSSH